MPLEDRASLRRKDQRTNKTTTRQCLRCDVPFESEGPGHRLCPTCHQVLEYGATPETIYHLTAPTPR